MDDTDMDDELNSAEPQAQPSPDSNQENNVAPGKRGGRRGRPASAKFSKPKVPTKRTVGGAMPGRKKAAPKKRATGKRVPLKEQTNVQPASETEEVEDFHKPANQETDPIEDASMDEQPPAEEVPELKKSTRGRKPAPKESKPQLKATERDGEFEYTPIRNGDAGFLRKLPAHPDAPNQAAEQIGASKEIPETQAEPMDVDPSSIPEEDEDEMPQSVYRQTSNLRAGSRARQPPVNRRRAESVLDTERLGSDPALRRKLGEMTKIVDNLQIRYDSLREVSVKEADANFDKLKAQSEAKSKGKWLASLWKQSLLTNLYSGQRSYRFLAEGSRGTKGLGPRIQTSLETNNDQRQ